MDQTGSEYPSYSGEETSEINAGTAQSQETSDRKSVIARIAPDLIKNDKNKM